MELRLNHRSPVPLYHQIAETIRYQIATGQIPPGKRLPSIREAAASWQVNMHTVRHAFQELAEDGLVEIRGPQGTWVLGSATPAKRLEQRSKLDDFVRRILGEGQAEHGLARDDLVRILANYQPGRSGGPSIVHVMECSETQCLDHTEEINARWDVDARPWCLSRAEEPPPGALVATYFHLNEIRRRWPHRVDEVQFVSIHPDPDLLADLRTAHPPLEGSTLVVCEYDEQMAENVTSDLSVLFKDESYGIEPRIVDGARAVLGRLAKHSLVLVTPRVWGDLTEEERADSRVKKVRYRFTESSLESLGEVFGWSRQGKGT